MRGLVLAAAAALTLASSAGAQNFFSETLEVRVVNVDVIVTKDGKPVPGLTVDDFELYENGERRDISNFAEVAETTPAGTLTPATAGETPAPKELRRRSIVLYIDDAALHPLDRNTIFPAMRAFLHENVRPADTVTIVEWSSALTVELQPTSDPAAIDAAVDRLSKRTTGMAPISGHEAYSTALADLITMYKMREPPEKPRFAAGLTIVSGWAERVSYEMRRRAEALKSVLASLRGGEGRKVLVLVTTAFASNPGEEAFAYLDSIRDEFITDGAGSAMMDAKKYELTGLVTSIGEMANSSGIALYPLDAAGKNNDTGVADASRHVRVASQAALVPHTSTALLQAIAAETGGVATTGSTNWKLAFTTIASDLSTYYSLGYHAPAVRQDGLKRIEVKLRKRGYAVRTRHAIVEQTAGSEMNDAVSSNLFRASATNELRVQATAAASSTAIDGSLTVPVTITIPMDALTLVPDGADLTGSFSLYAAFLRDDGAVSHVSQQPHRFRFPASSLARRKQITLQLDVSADARTDAISVGVMDELSKATGFATVKLP